MSLNITDLSKKFGRFPALNNVSLEVADGEFLALLGPSGSGKTTLLRIIAGLEMADKGEIDFNGANFLKMPVGERRIGFVFQHYALFKHMSAAQNIAFGLNSLPQKRRPTATQIADKTEELLNLVQLDGLGARYPSQLSGGQRQRVALARALAIEPQMLLLDEPFGALDAKVRRDLRRWLRDLHEKMGLTTIFVTHDQEEALEIADRVVVMQSGQLEQIGTPADLYHNPVNPFVYDFLGDTLRFDCLVSDGVAQIDGVNVPILGQVPSNGPASAHVRPDAITIGKKGEKGLAARVRAVLLAGPDARIDCELENGTALEVRIAHNLAGKLSVGSTVSLTPQAVRVWR